MDRIFEALRPFIRFVVTRPLLVLLVAVGLSAAGLNYLLKLKGIHPARDFDKRQRDALLKNAMAKRRLRGDAE